jgi:alpha/beta superfamily hydrolase
MSIRSLRETVGPAGRLEVRVDDPDGPVRAVAVVAPPHPQLGGSLYDRVVYHATQGLARIGCVVWRFNFRGVGTSQGEFDGATGEVDDMRAIVDRAAAETPESPLWTVGYSFGAWVATQVGTSDPRVTTLVAIAPPVTGYDFAALETSPKPKFLIHGERDEMTPLKAVRLFYASLVEPRELVVIDGANHVFDGHASELSDAVEELLG